MRIIRLEIQVISRNYTIQVLRQAVGLDRRLIKRIREFVDYVKQLCNLKGEYEIDIDGFSLAPNDTIKVLKESRVYTLRLAREPIINGQKNQYQQNDSEIESDQNLEVHSGKNKSVYKPNARQFEIKKSKIQQKNAKQHEKNRVLKNRQMSSQSEEESESEQESEEQQIQIKPRKNINTQLQNTQKGGLKKELLKQNIQKKNISQSDSSSELPMIQKEVKQPVQKNIQKPLAKVQKKPILSVTNDNKVRQGVGIKKSIIRDSSSQSSPSKEKTPEVKPKKKLSPEPQKNIQNPKPQNLKLPPALRNKIQTNNFVKHQQNQWIIVDKEKYHKWQQLGHQTLSQPPNKIRFKIVQLDEEKFIPVKSNWITGEVVQIANSGVVHLINVQQEGKDFMKNYQIPQMNMDELQIFRPLATKEQIQCLCGINKEENQRQTERAEPIKTEVTLLHEPPNSVEKFVCGQVNYYFSDKNYLTDCYMQLHANSHPQKYMRLSFMLNFPKIKKVLRDEDKLLDYLREDDKYESRNYEIDFANKMIRKKNIKQQPKNINQAKLQQVSQEKESFPVSGQVKLD